MKVAISNIGRCNLPRRAHALAVHDHQIPRWLTRCRRRGGAQHGERAQRPGDRVALFSYGVHHSPKYWEDPEEFRPERWLGDAAKKRKPYTYIPFGGGKRSCIGGAMSQVENTLALSILLRRFRPEYVGAEPPGINATVTLTPRGGLPFKIHELN